MTTRNSRFWIRFWGVRGSLATPGKQWVKYGGNTSCVEIRCDDQIFIIDLGSGARPMGGALFAEAPLSANILFSHYHYDHICGMPFCGILYDPRNSFEIYGEARGPKKVKSVLSGQMKYPYFPVGIEALGSKIKYHTIAPGDVIQKGDVRVKTASLNHPQSAIAYRTEFLGKSIVYCSDNEHQQSMPKKLANLIQGTDVLIYDAAYTDEIYDGKVGGGSKVGWGHSTWSEAIKAAKDLKVGALYIFHHDPMMTDSDIDGLLAANKKKMKNLEAAREGMVVSLA